MMRKPFVAGQFYPGRARELREMLLRMTGTPGPRGKERSRSSPRTPAIFIPAPWRVRFFSSVLIPDTVVILGPAHSAIRPVFAVQDEGAWETPLGEVPIETDLADAILEACPLVPERRGRARPGALPRSPGPFSPVSSSPASRSFRSACLTELPRRTSPAWEGPWPRPCAASAATSSSWPART